MPLKRKHGLLSKYVGVPGVLGGGVASDTTAPTVEITSAAAATVYAPFSVTITFSEAVVGFELADITVGNGTASALAGTGPYTATITPTAEGVVTVDVGAGICQDAAGNDNTAATQLTRTLAFAGPYDSVANVEVAFGVRRLLASYAGQAVKLRRSSDAAESDFGFDSAGNLDAAAIASWLGAASGYLTTWYDQSGNGKHLAQTTADNQPLYVASTTGSKPGFRWDTNDTMLTAAFAEALTQPNTICAVAKASDFTATRSYFDGIATTSRGNFYGSTVSTTQRWYLYAGSSAQMTTNADTDYHAFIALFNGAASTLRADSTEYTGSAGTQTLTGLRAGSRMDGSQSLNGDICELMVIDGALSAGEVETIEASQSAYFGLNFM